MQTGIKMLLGTFLIQNFNISNQYIYSRTHGSIFRSVGWFNFDENTDAKVKTHKKIILVTLFSWDLTLMRIRMQKRRHIKKVTY